MKRLRPMLAALLCAFCVHCPGAFAADLPQGWFEFAMPQLGGPGSLVDVSWLSPERAGAAGFVHVRDGHFVDGSGRRLRLLGSNCTFGGAFPPKDVAPKIAARMSAFGMNVVRFHHMDCHTAPRGLWNKSRDGLDPAQLDRLDWFIYNLIQNGVYANINLHVSRTYPGMSWKLARAFRFGKGLDNFYPPFIQLQHEYARDLLTHRNPYTNTTYVNEPGVLCIEINNENSILTKRIQDLTALPDPFRAELARQWRAWLKQQFANTAALHAKWDAVDEPLGKQMLANRDFAQGRKGWRLEAPRPARGTTQPSDDGPRPGVGSLRCELTALGTKPWHFQLHQVGLDLKHGQTYNTSFWVKADPPRKVYFDVRMDCAPWSSVGCRRTLDVTKQWKRFEFTFECTNPKPKHSRLSFNFTNKLGVCWVADASLRPGGFIGLPKDQSLEAGSVDLPGSTASPAMQADFRRFLIAVERGYVAGMMRFLKHDLGVKQLVIDTQASYGGVAGVHREATLCDFIDVHAYWQHPHFPGRPWDGSNWFIPNTSMVANADGGTLARLAVHRVAGMPLTVSEYDHPAPNDHSAEMFPMVAACAAAQDWDAVYQFNYANSDGAWTDAKISGYFEMANHPAKMTMLPVAAIMFRAGGVARLAAHTTLRVPEDRIAELYGRNRGDMRRLWQGAGFELADVVKTRMAVQFAPSGPLTLTASPGAPGQVQWNPAKPATFTVNAPSVRAAVGFVGGRKIELGDAAFDVAPSETNWASMALAALDAKPLAQSKRILLVAAGRAENSNMGWNNKRTTVGRNWGDEPTIAEGIAATVTLPPGRWQACALDAGGNRKADVATAHEAGRATLHIGPQRQTLWYLIQPR